MHSSRSDGASATGTISAAKCPALHAARRAGASQGERRPARRARSSTCRPAPRRLRRARPSMRPASSGWSSASRASCSTAARGRSDSPSPASAAPTARGTCSRPRRRWRCRRRRPRRCATGADDRFEPAAAQPVDGRRRDRRRQAGQQQRHPADVAVVLAGPVGVAERTPRRSTPGRAPAIDRRVPRTAAAGRSSGRTPASAPPSRPSGVRTASTMKLSLAHGRSSGFGHGRR